MCHLLLEAQGGRTPRAAGAAASPPSHAGRVRLRPLPLTDSDTSLRFSVPQFTINGARDESPSSRLLQGQTRGPEGDDPVPARAAEDSRCR